MVDLAYTADELKEKKTLMAGNGPEIGDIEKYPWGTQLRLNDAIVKKLGIGTPAVGSEMMIMAKVKVTEVEAREEADGDVKNHVTLQITDMNMQGQGVTNANAADKLYGKEGE